MSDYLSAFITSNGYLAYKKFASFELTKHADKLTTLIHEAENALNLERKELILEIQIIREQIDHILSHLKYLYKQVKEINPYLLKQISMLVNTIRYDRQYQLIPQLLHTLLSQIGINLYQLSIIEQSEIELLVYMVRRDKRIVQNRVQFATLNEKFIKLIQATDNHVNKRLKLFKNY